MSAQLTDASWTSGASGQAPARRYWLAAGAVCALAFAGFARTYYLKRFFGTPGLSTIVHLHALVLSAWCVTFATQTWLVATHRIVWHRRLGVAAALLAVLVVMSGTWLTIAAVAREGAAHKIGKFHFLFGLNLVNLLLFAALVGAGLLLRRHRQFHKRLMLLAAITSIAPAIARLVLLFTHAPLPQFLVFYACIAAPVLVDTVRHRRLHPAFAWGGLAVIVGFQLVFFVEQSPAYLAFVIRLFG